MIDTIHYLVYGIFFVFPVEPLVILIYNFRESKQLNTNIIQLWSEKLIVTEITSAGDNYNFYGWRSYQEPGGIYDNNYSYAGTFKHGRHRNR